MIRQIRLVVLIPKKLWNGQRDWEVWPRKESLVHTLCPFLVGRLLALAGWYKPPTGFCHSHIWSPWKPRAGLCLFCAGHVIHSHRHTCRVRKVQQKTCSLGEQRTRARSILIYLVPDEPPRWKVAAEPQKMLGFLASRGEEFNLGLEMRLDHSELLCNKVLFKYKEIEKASVIDIRRGQKECPLTSVSNGVIYFLTTYYSESKECLEVVKISLDPLP